MRNLLIGICGGLVFLWTLTGLGEDPLPPPVQCEVFGGIAVPPEVVIQWPRAPEGTPVVAYLIFRDGELIAELSAETHDYIEEPMAGEHEYSVWLLLQSEESQLVGECIVNYDPPRIGGFLRGDANADGERDISDAVFVLQFLFTGGSVPRCEKSADSDDNGFIVLTDPVFLLNFLFLSGPPPEEPFEECGDDRTVDDLSCEEFPPCFHPPPP